MLSVCSLMGSSSYRLPSNSDKRNTIIRGLSCEVIIAADFVVIIVISTGIHAWMYGEYTGSECRMAGLFLCPTNCNLILEERKNNPDIQTDLSSRRRLR